MLGGKREDKKKHTDELVTVREASCKVVAGMKLERWNYTRKRG